MRELPLIFYSRILVLDSRILALKLLLKLSLKKSDFFFSELPYYGWMCKKVANRN